MAKKNNFQEERAALEDVLLECNCPADRREVFLSYLNEHGELSDELTDELFEYIEADLDKALEEVKADSEEIQKVGNKIKEIEESVNNRMLEVTQRLHAEVKAFMKGLTEEVELMLDEHKTEKTKEAQEDLRDILSL